MKQHLLTIVAGVAMFLLAWFIYKPKSIPPEPAAPAVRQKDGSLELERVRQGSATPAQIKPAGIIPKGGKVEREIRVTVDPNVPEANPRGKSGGPSAGGDPRSPGAPLDSPAGPRCPQVTVDLSLVRMPDQTRRVIASSPNGTVVGGLDVPIENPKLTRIPRWTASGLVGYDSNAKRNVYGGAVQYNRGPFAFTGGVIGGTAFAGAGIRF
jgi:hypothetical protein